MTDSNSKERVFGFFSIHYLKFCRAYCVFEVGVLLSLWRVLSGVICVQCLMGFVYYV